MLVLLLMSTLNTSVSLISNGREGLFLKNTCFLLSCVTDFECTAKIQLCYAASDY